MQIITPIEITDDILTSPIAEPDVSAGEVEWVDPNEVSLFGDLYRDPAEVLERDGIIYAVLDSTNKISKIDLGTESITTIDDAMPLTGGATCANIDDNKIFITTTDGGDGTSSIGVFSISSESYTAIGTINQYCKDGVDGNDGKIYYFGISSDLAVEGKVYSFDKSLRTISELTGSYVSGEKGAYHGGKLSNEGFIYAVGSSGRILKIDVKNSSIDEFGSYSGTYYAIEKDDGFMYCVGDSGVVMRIETETDLVTFISSSNNYYRDIVKTSDGFFMLTGYNLESGLELPIIDSFDSSNSVITKVSSADPATDPAYLLFYYQPSQVTYAFGAKSRDNLDVRIRPIIKVPTHYNSGEQVIILDEHSVYKSAVNTRDNPVVGSELTPPTWVKVSATNKYKMFDYSINTASSSVGDIQLLSAQTTTTLSMYGMSNVASVNIIVKENSSSGAEIYNVTKDLTLPTPVDDMIANEALYRSKVMFSDLPVFANPWISIVINRADTAENWSIGDIAIGNARTMGVVVYQSSTSRTSYDSVETDDFGNETIISRPSAEYTTFELSLKPIYADYVERILKDSLNKPRVYIGDKGNNEKLFTFGYYERSPITYVSPSLCETTLKVRGLV